MPGCLIAMRRPGSSSLSLITTHLSPVTNTSCWNWIILWIIALATRLSAAFLLPNAEQDGYSYAEIIARWSASLSEGHFRLADLFSFWMPLFSFAAAIPNVWINHPLLVGKILSGLCGATSCLLVFTITKQLTRSLVLAWLAFAVVLSSPLYILYSAACMTDIPHACLVLASLWCALQRRWLGAAIFAAIAEGVRIEAWALIILLPLLQFVYERRVSLLGLTILLLPPIAWLGICQLATGDPFAFFADHARYQIEYRDFHPSDVGQDIDFFLLGANRVAFFSIIVAAGLSILPAARRRRPPPFAAFLTLGYTVALLGFILFAYISGRQPVLLPRYSLIFFVLGVPFLMWLVRFLIKQQRPLWFAKLIAATLIGLCLWEGKKQLPVISKVFSDFRAHRQVAEILAMAFQESRDLEQRCFSDDAAVRVLSGLLPERFVRSATAPVAARQDIGGFQSFLREQRVAYLVFIRTEDSLPVKFYPQLGRSDQADTGNFQLIALAPSPFGPDVWLYRLRD
jgi:hypothetical protein